MSTESTSTGLPSAEPVEIKPNVIIQSPLSRCGQGPALILIRPSHYSDCQKNNTSLDPEPLQKWAEESFAVAQVTLDPSGESASTLVHSFQTAKAGLADLPARTGKDQHGLIIYGSRKDYSPDFAAILQETLQRDSALVAIICFDTWGVSNETPVLFHSIHNSMNIAEISEKYKVYTYSDVAGPDFVIPGHSSFRMSTAGVAHTRSLTFLKQHLHGPYFDLEQIWNEHTYYEFGDRSVEKTMATMVQEPYVNHVPTMTGGIGRARLSNFYLNHFIHSNPDDTSLDLISRTVGTDRIVDEFIFRLTHSKQVDWLLPGIPPTGKPLRIPFTAVVNIRGDRLYHEHIAWDQATVLVQAGLMPQYLPFPYPLPDGKVPAPGKRFEYRVPAAGAESADKLQNEHALPSNQMFEYDVREVEE